MKYKWLNKSNNTNLIVFFNGWGMDEGVIKHLDNENYDVLMFYDYNSLETDFDFETLKEYQNKYLIAWSMGVMIATLFNKINYTKKVAINGTLKPIDNKFGIPQRIYDLTVNNFSPLGAKKFINNMFNSEIADLNIQRTFEEQKSELAALREYSANLDFKYDKVFISNDDKIIPTKNQIAYWKSESNLNAGHAPFLLFNKWSDLL